VPSPIGHALGGVAVACLADLLPGQPILTRRLAWTCATLAALPDADLLLPIAHRTATHSVAAVATVTLLMIVAAAVTGKVTPKIVVACVGAYASHLLLDWLQADPTPPFGLQLLWPMSSTWFISGWEIFRATERRHVFEPATIGRNVLAVLQEIAILGPVAVASWLVRVKALAGLPPEVAGGHHPPE
jgi:membrane-bound metal-dependent hydrolase YbcI (DUF457 family)